MQLLRMDSLGRLRIWVIAIMLVSHAYTGIALAIPASPKIAAVDAVSTPLRRRFLAPRAELDTVSTDAMFYSSPATEINAESGLPPIKEVLQAMMNQAAASVGPSDSSPLTGQPSPSLPTASLSGQPGASITATAVSPLASPPKQGPGIVLPPSTVLPGFSATGQSPEPTSTNANSTNASAKNNSHMVLILGTIIGGILCVTLCIFFVFDSSISARFFGFFKLSKFRSSKKDRGISHRAEPSFMVVDRGSPERTFDSMTHSRFSPSSPSPEKGEKGDSTLIGIQAHPVLSKFSICSSDYLSASTRDSAVTSTTAISDDLTSRNSIGGSPTRPSTVTFATNHRPTRPPRPPTADSPMLSDSVYLACSNQPYVIVAPPPLKSVDAAANPPPKKMLTPSEFFALHVPGIISSLVGNNANNNSGGSGSGNSNGKRERARATMAVELQPSGVARTGSQHSRTKSAPLLGSLRSVMTRATKTAAVAGDSQDAGESGSSEIAQRVTKHRRSRSASGWAYPDRLRPRKTFIH